MFRGRWERTKKAPGSLLLPPPSLPACPQSSIPRGQFTSCVSPLVSAVRPLWLDLLHPLLLSHPSGGIPGFTALSLYFSELQKALMFSKFRWPRNWVQSSFSTEGRCLQPLIRELRAFPVLRPTVLCEILSSPLQTQPGCENLQIKCPLPGVHRL